MDPARHPLSEAGVFAISVDGRHERGPSAGATTQLVHRRSVVPSGSVARSLTDSGGSRLPPRGSSDESGVAPSEPSASLCAAFEGPNIRSEDSTRVVLKALLIAGDECERRARANYFAQGFMEALTTLGPSRSSTPPAAPLEREAMGQFAAGWQTAEPFFAEARLARGHEHSPSAPRSKRRRRPKGAPTDRFSAAPEGTGGPRQPHRYATSRGSGQTGKPSTPAVWRSS